jgi:hypothetical protein
MKFDEEFLRGMHVAIPKVNNNLKRNVITKLAHHPFQLLFKKT